MSASPFSVKALFEYTSDHEDDLTFSVGQIIAVKEEEDEEWYFGEYTDESGTKREGLFPRNFVERYEPPAPPRPSRPNRSRKEPGHAPPGETVPPPAPVEPTSTRGSLESERAHVADTTPQVEPIPAPQPDPVNTSAPAVTAPAPSQPTQPSPPEEKIESAPKAAPKPAPPPVAEKPTGSSFRDRIAAFNKPAAAPVTPFNPNKPASNSFIRKPFVAPPPSKNAYVPPPQSTQPPPRVYRREEDPEIQERTAEDQAMAERHFPTNEGEEEGDDQPKPISLKDKIALLQKQQLEQAARHSGAAQKKDKPKKPPKKDVEQELEEQPAVSDPNHEPDLERTEAPKTAQMPGEFAQPQEDDRDVPPPRTVPVVTSPLQPPRELTSDTNDADNSGAGDTEEADETSTSKEDLSDGSRERKQSIPIEEKSHPDRPLNHGEEEDESDEQTEGEMDPEIKRRMEIRERMAKMSGGMGMMGMFGPPGGAPGTAPGGPKNKKSQPPAEPSRKSLDEQRAAPATQAPPVPVMPGMRPKDHDATPPDVEEDDKVQLTPVPTVQQQPPVEVTEELQMDADKATPPPPSVTQEPPPPPEASRPVPPPVPAGRPIPDTESQTAPLSPHDESVSHDIGEETDDEFSGGPEKSARGVVPTELDEGPLLPARSYTADEVPSSSTVNEKRYSRGPPPPPPAVPAPAHNRPPPPPPPTGVSRKSTSDSRVGISAALHPNKDDSDEEVTEYDGDYDTDIAPGAKHKDALKAHGRDSSLEEGTITDDFNTQSPVNMSHGRPPVPSTTAPRAAPPPPPTQPPKQARKSSDIPRIPPPPVPPPKDPYEDTVGRGDDEYDPFRYDNPAPVRVESRTTTTKAPTEESRPYDLYSASPPIHSAPSAPPPPPPDRAAIPAPQSPQSPPSSRNPPRQSMEILKGSGNTRRSMDVPRPSMDQGYIANDVDLGHSTMWWTQPNTPPPVFQNRNDILVEIEESGASKRSGKTSVSKDVYVLFMDYSQTVISVQFDSRNPEDVALEQRSEPPPPRLRQDQLENAHTQFGTRISESVASKQNTTVADGTPHSLAQSLLTPLSDAVHPVGVRAYGALVYANLANASVQQMDEIRAGDIVTFRNARFQGHRGTMHQKYNSEVGKPDHVGVVVDWDGTKKKIRAWEQGRESKKVKMESFKLGDLRSGECRVWRVMPRSWLGWDGDGA